MATERADAAPVLSQRALNRALLARQLLLERAEMPLPRALERMAGLQAQYAPSMYIGLWSRVEGFRPEDLTTGLEQRTVVQGTLLRMTIHLVSAEDYWPFALAIRAARRALWLRLTRGADEKSVAAAAARLEARLREGGPVRRKELDGLVAGAGPSPAAGVGAWIDLVRVPPSGTWARRRADLYELAETWLGPPPDGEDDPAAEAGRELLVRRYLGGFGPGSPAEIADWAGLPVADVTAVLDRLPHRRFRTEDGKPLVDLPDAPLPDPETPAPVRFLPTWDATLLVHCRRSGILPEDYRPRIFNTKVPLSIGTFLVDGSVAGTWRYDGGRITTDPFAPLDRSAQAEVAAEADRLAEMHRG